MEQKANSFLETERLGRLMAKCAVPCVISLLVAALYNIQDRVLHHCTVINIKGESYRLKERKEFMRQKQQIGNTLFQQGST